MRHTSKSSARKRKRDRRESPGWSHRERRETSDQDDGRSNADITEIDGGIPFLDPT